jgi:hypothetical protein
MSGDFDDDDLSDVSVPGENAAGPGRSRSLRGAAPEALDDGEGDGAVEKQEFTMKFTADGLVKVDRHGDVVAEPEAAQESSPSVVHPVGTRVSANYRASEQLGGFSAWYDGAIKRVHRGEDRSVAYDIDYDDGDFEEGVEPRHVRIRGDADALAEVSKATQSQEEDKQMKLKRQKARDQARYVVSFRSSGRSVV